MDWSVAILPQAEKDIATLVAKRHYKKGDIEDAILDEFEDFKGDRVQKLFVSGVSTASLDKLAASEYSGSIRTHVMTDLRATAICLPEYRQVNIVHVFHKDEDRDYKAAVPTHDQRVAAYLATLTNFVRKKR